MTIAGNLETMALSDILQWLSTGGYTGTLMVSNGAVDKSIYFRDGRIISCTSTNPKEILGHFLVSHGGITEKQLSEAVTEQEHSRELLGKILVQQGALTSEKLEAMLKLQAEESIYELFRWQEGQFRFIDKQLPKYEMVPISLDVTGLMLEGMRRIDEWQRIHDAIPSPMCVPVAVADLLEDEEDEARRAVLETVNDDRTVEEIGLETHSGEYFVGEILFQKVRDGKLKMVRPRIVSSASELPLTSADSLLAEARARLGNKEFEPALRRLRAAGSLEPDNREMQREIRDSETEIRALLEIDGVDVAGVPRIVTALAELSEAELSPEEGFILSRVDGTADVASIIKISPLPELDALLVFWRLLKAEHISLYFP